MQHKSTARGCKTLVYFILIAVETMYAVNAKDDDNDSSQFLDVCFL